MRYFKVLENSVLKSDGLADFYKVGKIFREDEQREHSSMPISRLVKEYPSTFEEVFMIWLHDYKVF